MTLSKKGQVRSLLIEVRVLKIERELQVFGKDSFLNLGLKETQESRDAWLADMDIDVNFVVLSFSLKIATINHSELFHRCATVCVRQISRERCNLDLSR